MTTALEAEPSAHPETVHFDPIAALANARRIDAAIRVLGQNKNRLKAEISFKLLEMHRADGARSLGHGDIGDYGHAALDYSRSHTRQLVTMAEQLESLPLLRADFVEGKLPWTKVRTAAAAATSDPGSEALWHARAHDVSNAELERMAAEARGEDPVIRMRLSLSPEQASDIDDAVRAITQEHRGESMTQEAALAEICRRMLQGAAKPLGGPRHRVVLTVCTDCKKTTREGREGPVRVSSESAATVACYTELLDIRNGPGDVGRTISRRTTNFVEARDRGRCRVPGCRNRVFLNFHHEGGWLNVGDDPSRIFLMCERHHRARHFGQLNVEIKDNVVRFFLADGSPHGDGFRLDDGTTVNEAS
jgi:hypothetical protein